MIIEEQIGTILQSAADSIKAKMAEKEINATGRTSRSIKVKRIAAGFALGKFPEGEQTAPIKTIEIGRPGGKVPKYFKYIIWDWMEAKGIASGDPKEDARRAGAIAYGKYGIKNIGTRRHRKHEDVFSSIVEDTANEIRVKVKDIILLETIKTVNKSY